MALTRTTETGARTEIVVDRIACDGFGMCAELLPELIELDDWGYPVIHAGGVPDYLVDHARRAVAVCPVLALKLARRSTAPVERGQAGWQGPAAGGAATTRRDALIRDARARRSRDLGS